MNTSYYQCTPGIFEKLFHQGHQRLLVRSEEHTSELQSRENLVCRLLLEKKNKTTASRSAPPLAPPLRHVTVLRPPPPPPLFPYTTLFRSNILASATAYVNWPRHLTRPTCGWAYEYLLLPVHARHFRETLSSRPSKAPCFLLCYSGRQPLQGKGISPGIPYRV